MREQGVWCPTAIVVTCEHAGREVPRAYRAAFRGAGDALRSHRGWDPGAFGVATRLAAGLGAPLHLTCVTRLLVDANRSAGNPDRFSQFVRGLSAEQHGAILTAYYEPHWRNVEATIGGLIALGRRVLHVGVHTCTDELHGSRRELECAFLYDESLAADAAICRVWRDALVARRPAWRCPFNEPYKGTDDGITTILRQRFPVSAYAGIELEMRQGFVRTRWAQRRVALELLSAWEAAVVALPEH